MQIINKGSKSVFERLGYRQTIDQLVSTISELYLSFDAPWIIGYSGGKDSTAVLQLVWMALESIPSKSRKNKVHVISTDTLVENPVVASWVSKQLRRMDEQATLLGLPLETHRLTPELEDSFWVNLIGKGYPAPRPKFRWCTSRLKINPSNKFITEIIKKHGEAILALGMRKAESSMRAMSMDNIEKRLGRVQEYLTPNASLPNSYVFTPIENWENDDVWQFLLHSSQTPWDTDNSNLLDFYKGATKDRECPMAITTGTPSCGDSRFGCWVCTMVSQDRSMLAMIQNDQEKEWMQPLLEYRDSFNIKEDRERRDFRRIDGRVQLFKDRAIHGPYWQDDREDLLRRLLQVQEHVKSNKPEDVPDFDIITIKELKAIREVWREDKDEVEDSLPRIYKEVTGNDFPLDAADRNPAFGWHEMKILKTICGDDKMHYQLVRGLISQSQRYRTMARRSGLFDALEQVISKHFYEDEEDAENRVRNYQEQKRNIKDRLDLIHCAPYVRRLENDTNKNE
ncbi:DNA phosphorothioation system sulfurtransferase DndC [Desulfopila inferna]|uniref:DNA phosphorothioation system sulfurtransferase DndC n=1 Tax=Desulfopila inferna TaxID=468528 RepID=UPI001962E7B6|nr:DNA phosphorothioation system sulfurtransferase DndC [Desulfopila inferna]MBM9606730.1 DNA phosphorothioation system sulfurtransferase DndC [Desulfopila inferna]